MKKKSLSVLKKEAYKHYRAFEKVLDAIYEIDELEGERVLEYCQVGSKF